MKRLKAWSNAPPSNKPATARLAPCNCEPFPNRSMAGKISEKNVAPSITPAQIPMVMSWSLALNRTLNITGTAPSPVERNATAAPRSTNSFNIRCMVSTDLRSASLAPGSRHSAVEKVLTCQRPGRSFFHGIHRIKCSATNASSGRMSS